MLSVFGIIRILLREMVNGKFRKLDDWRAAAAGRQAVYQLAGLSGRKRDISDTYQKGDSLRRNVRPRIESSLSLVRL